MFKLTDKDPDFWVQLKGDNAGKPLLQKIPNSIGIKVNPGLLVPDFLFYTILYLFQTGLFKPFIKGSVIPYIRQSDIVHVILAHFIKTYALKPETTGAQISIREVVAELV